MLADIRHVDMYADNEELRPTADEAPDGSRYMERRSACTWELRGGIGTVFSFPRHRQYSKKSRNTPYFRPPRCRSRLRNIQELFHLRRRDRLERSVAVTTGECAERNCWALELLACCPPVQNIHIDRRRELHSRPPRSKSATRRNCCKMNFGIDARGAGVTMTQQIPDLLQGCTLFQQMSGTRMPQTVRSASPALDACRLACFYS